MPSCAAIASTCISPCGSNAAIPFSTLTFNGLVFFPQTSKRFFAEAYTQPVEVGISGHDWVLSAFPAKNNFINIRTGFDGTTKQFLDLPSLLSPVVHNTDFYWAEIGANQLSADTHKRSHPKLNLVYVAVARDT